MCWIMWTVKKLVAGNGYKDTKYYKTSNLILAYFTYYVWRIFDFGFLGIHPQKEVVLYASDKNFAKILKSYNKKGNFKNGN